MDFAKAAVALGLSCAVAGCDPALVELGRAFPPSSPQAYSPATAAPTTLRDIKHACAQREAGAVCGGTTGVSSDYFVCVDGRCEESRCGDGVVDARAGEFCESGAEDAAAGCQACQLSCQADEECSDLSACNGVERCVAGHCEHGTPVDCDDGDPSTPSICVDSDGSCRHALELSR